MMHDSSPESRRDVPLLAEVPGLLSVAGAAQVLGCSSRTVRRRIAERELPAVVDHGRLKVRTDELRVYVESLSRPGDQGKRRRARSSTGRFDFLRKTTDADAR